MKSPPQHEQALAALRAAVRDLGERPGPLEPAFEKFLLLADRYARLEKLVLGAVPLQFPAHLFLNEQPGGDPLETGAQLADRERQRLNLGHGAVDEPAALIEQQGLKVIELSLPEESGIMGAFIFNEITGPAILVDAGRGTLSRDYALIHEYGHFLADNDPYRTWVCRQSLEPAAPLEELRAHVFAGAFLVPQEDLDAYLGASGLRKGDAITPGLLNQLRTYFEADDRALIGRLLTSGWLRRGDVSGLLDDAGEPSPREIRAPSGTVPARFVRLAVMARRAGRLSLAELAHYLEVDEATARQIESSLLSEQEEESHGDSAD